MLILFHFISFITDITQNTPCIDLLCSSLSDKKYVIKDNNVDFVLLVFVYILFEILIFRCYNCIILCSQLNLKPIFITN